MLWLARIGPSDKQAPVGDVSKRRPYLLPVDQPLVAVANGTRGERGDVGPGPRLAEELTPDVLAGEDAPQQPVLHVRCPEGQQHRRGHADADRIETDVVIDARRSSQLVVDDHLGFWLQAEAALARPGTAPTPGLDRTGRPERQPGRGHRHRR